MYARRICALTLILIASTFLYAEGNDSIRSKHTFWDSGIGKVLKFCDNLLYRWENDGIDTTYIQVPKHDRMIYLGAYSYYQQHDMQFPGQTSANLVAVNMHNVNTELELGIDWRGLVIELPIPITDRHSQSYGLSTTGSVWGAGIRYKSISDIDGKIEKGENTPDILPIGRGQLDLKTFYLEGYYVFNHKRFSLAAGLFGDMIQKKSAGGIFLMGNYYQSRLGCNNLLNYSRDTFRNNKVSIGVGFGYNLALLDGSLCIHASITPMASLLNRVTHKHYGEPIEQNNQYYDCVELGRNSDFTFNFLGRFGISYSINENVLLNFYAYYRQHLFEASTGLHIGNREGDFQFNIGYRF